MRTNCASRAVRHCWRQIGVRLLPDIQLHMECVVCKATKWVRPTYAKSRLASERATLEFLQRVC